jgi:Holliday junction resolvase-like predicted endonuclease
MTRTRDLEQSIEIVIPLNWTNDQKGGYLESVASKLLQRQSYDVTERIRFTGMEIDILANHKPSSDIVYVECKFLSSNIGANVIDLMIGQAFRRKLTRVALFSAGSLSKEAKGAVEDLKTDDRISFSFYGPDALLTALIDAGLAPKIIEEELRFSISHATLLVYPEYPYIWLFQEQKDGRPFRIIPYTLNSSNRPKPAEIRSLLDNHQILEGLQVVDYLDTRTSQVSHPLSSAETLENTEAVGRVATADTILDYRPCSPDDFVGRRGLQKEIWDFLSEVRDGTTETRLIALVGASGYGKSSLVTKLSARFRNKKWKNKYFLFPVDVRSARGPLFVAEALLQAIRSAAEADFLTPPENLSISDAGNILASESIKKLFADLSEKKKVLILFFDQFEEVFTKDELLPVFRVFRRFALDVQANLTNLVVGFSWRTGISFSDDNPAYQLWNELRDHRITKNLGTFDSGESSNLITQFEDELGTKLLPPLRRRLLEQGQGLPWFLKKLCIHLYRQVKDGVSQSDLLGGRLNVKSLFDEDLDPLSESQLSCLRYIALNSPVDSLEVFERYSNEIISGLSDKRLIVRAGQRFAVYWDVFRDYLTEGKVPAIPWTYIPNCTLKMALSTCELLDSQGSKPTMALARELSYSNATIVNIITDLQNLGISGKESNGEMSILDGLDMKSIAERIRSQFSEHIFYQQLLQNGDDNNSLSRQKALEIIRDLYSGADVKPRTRDNYLNRLVPWLEYAGLIELNSGDIQVFLPTKRSPLFGVSSHTRRSGAVFLASAPPEDAEGLLIRLQADGTLTRETISNERLRNPTGDLSALGLAQWTTNGLVVTSKAKAHTTPRECIGNAAQESRSITILRKLVATNPNASRQEIGVMLATELGREWKVSSAVRYSNGLFRYLDYIS